MKLLRTIKDWFIYGGHFTALNVTLFPISVSILTQTPLDLRWILPLYLGCYGAYLFNRFEELEEDIETNPERSKYLKKRKVRLPIYILLSFVLVLGIPIILCDFTTVCFFLFLVILSLTYSTYWKKLTKKIPCFKNFYLALMFALLSSYPLFKYHKILNYCSLFLLLFIFLRIFVNTAFSDFKDVKSDKKKSLLTLPLITPKKARKILSLITIFSFFILLSGILMKFVPTFFLSLFLVTIYSLVYINTPIKQETHFTLWADGEGIVMFISSLLGVTVFTKF